MQSAKPAARHIRLLTATKLTCFGRLDQTVKKFPALKHYVSYE